MSLQSSEWFSQNGIECSRVIASGDAFPRHLHDEYVISANLTGTEEVWLEGKVSLAQAGQVTIYNPGSIQASRFDSNSVEFVSVHLPQSLLQQPVTQHNLRSGNAAPVLREGIFHDNRLFTAICRYAQSAQHQDASQQQQELLLLCGELLEDHRPAADGEEQAVSRVKAFLREHLTEKPQLDALAQLSGLSKYHLVRRFTQQTGMPPLQYHMQLRLHEARNLLRSNVHPRDAALMLGFYDQSHFINAFRKVMGITPHHYAQQIGSGRNKFPVA
ncbi:AraC family transcriptional regulator [Erwinia sp. V71]|uniref:AraC family transcriptional regulator n=1 Tax=Erwinia sp. V71 TaxID=3369424 RepID=UPI003F6060BA